MKKRVLCLILSVVLVMLALPISAVAYAHASSTPLPEGIYKSWKQYDERWTDVVLGVDPWTDSAGVYHTYETVGHAGCLISSMAILARAYGLTLADGTTIDPGTLGEAMYDGGSCTYVNERGAAKYSTAFDALIPGVLFYDLMQPADPVSAIAALLSDTGHEYAVILGVNSGAHYVAVDYVADGEVIICDPGYNKTKLSEYSFYCMLVYRIDESYVDNGNVITGQPVWQVQEEIGVKIRNGPGLSYERVSAYPCGARFEVSETAEADGYLWGKTPDGWCALRALDMTEIYCICLTVDQYSVTYHTNGGTGGPETQYKTAGEPLTLAAEIPEKEGFRFLGWSKDPSAVSASYTAGGIYEEDEALVLYAVWMEESAVFGYGIDVSSYQGVVDWETVAASGVSFVILRAGTSKGKDTMFEENYLGAKAAGLHVGSYMYTYATTEEEILEDAASFADWLSGKEFDMPVFADVETTEQSALPEGVLTSLVQTFQTYMTDAGYYCGVYSSASWYEQYLDGGLLGGREYLWVAKWTLSGTLSQNMSENYAMYQYSESGTVPGIEGAVDLNVCYVDYPSLIEDSDFNGNHDVHPLEGAGLTIADGVLAGGRVGMTVTDWQALFDGTVTFTDADGNALTADSVVTTGCKIDCGGRTYTVSVRGDLNGDGRIDAVDYIMLKRHVLGTYRLTGAAYRAGCLGGDTVTTVDYIKVKRHVLGTYRIYD